MFDDIQGEMRQKIEFYLAHSEKRMEIAKNGFDLVNGRHTYRDRLKTLFKTLGIALSEGH